MPAHPIIGPIVMLLITGQAFALAWEASFFSFNVAAVAVATSLPLGYLLDVLSSNATFNNLQRMEKAGLSKTLCILMAVYNVVSSAMGTTYLVSWYSDTYMRPFYQEKYFGGANVTTSAGGGGPPNWNAGIYSLLTKISQEGRVSSPLLLLVEAFTHKGFLLLTAIQIAKAVIIVLISDFIFYIGHRHMHEKTPSLHVIHHCCVEASATTGVFFHPIDLVMEFALPTLFLFLVSTSSFVGDPMVFHWALSILSAWYVLGHDEWMQFQHTRHHKYCGTNYFAYVNWWKETTNKDKVALEANLKKEKSK